MSDERPVDETMTRGREVLVEYVGGSHDGERERRPIIVNPGQTVSTARAPSGFRELARVGGKPRIGTEVYRRRACSEECGIDGERVWHYDIEPATRRASSATDRDVGDDPAGGRA